MAQADTQPTSPRALETTDPDGRSTEFVAIQGNTDSTSATSLLVAAYLLMWAVLLFFVLLTWRRQKSVGERVGELERLLDSKTDDS